MIQDYSPSEAINQIAKDNQITKPEEVDAFRHMYAAATSTDVLGGMLTRLGGNIIEMGGMVRFYIKSWLGLTEDTWTQADNDRYKDFYNNEIGIKIGQSSGSRAEIIEKIKDAIRSGEAIIDPTDARSRFEKDFPDSDTSRSFLDTSQPGAGGLLGGAHGFDLPSLAQALAQQQAGRRGRVNPLLTSAIGLLRELERGGIGRGRIEERVGGGTGRGGIVEALGEALGVRGPTRISILGETPGAEPWSMSRGQYASMLAGWIIRQSNRNG